MTSSKTNVQRTNTHTYTQITARDKGAQVMSLSTQYNINGYKIYDKQTFLAESHIFVFWDIVRITESNWIHWITLYRNSYICSHLALFLCGLVSKTGLSKTGLTRNDCRNVWGHTQIHIHRAIMSLLYSHLTMYYTKRSFQFMSKPPHHTYTEYCSIKETVNLSKQIVTLSNAEMIEIHNIFPMVISVRKWILFHWIMLNGRWLEKCMHKIKIEPLSKAPSHAVTVCSTHSRYPWGKRNQTTPVANLLISCRTVNCYVYQ